MSDSSQYRHLYTSFADSVAFLRLALLLVVLPLSVFLLSSIRRLFVAVPLSLPRCCASTGRFFLGLRFSWLESRVALYGLAVMIAVFPRLPGFRTTGGACGAGANSNGPMNAVEATNKTSHMSEYQLG